MEKHKEILKKEFQLFSVKQNVYKYYITGLAVCFIIGFDNNVLAKSKQNNNETESIYILPKIEVLGMANTSEYAGNHTATGGLVGMLGNKELMTTPFNTIIYTNKYTSDIQAKHIIDVISSTDAAVNASKINNESIESFSIRGFKSEIGDVMVNGSFGVAPYYRILPEMFDRIEVFKGPSALLNGMSPSGSVGGAINLVTKRAGDTPLLHFKTSYDSNSELGFHVDAGKRFGENKQFGSRVNLVTRGGKTSTEKQEIKNHLLSIGLDWSGEKALASVDLYASKDKIKGLTRGISLSENVPVIAPPVKASQLLNPDWAELSSKDKGITLRGELDIANQITAYATTSFSKGNLEADNVSSVNILNKNGNFAVNRGIVLDDIQRRSVELGLKGQFLIGGFLNQWTANINSLTMKQQMDGKLTDYLNNTSSNIYNPIWDSKNDNFSRFIRSNTDTHLISYGIANTVVSEKDTVQLTVGVRRQEVSIEGDTNLSRDGVNFMNQNNSYKKGITTPGIALLVKATNNLSVYGNYIEGLSKGEIAPINAVNAGEVLAPFKTKQKELGIKYDLGNLINTLSIYELNRASSYLDPETNIFSGIGEQKNKGIEWNVFGALTDNLRLMGGLSYLNAKIIKDNQGTSDKRAIGTPKLQGKLRVELDLPKVDGLTVNANINSVSKQYLDKENKLEINGYTTYDIGARYATKIYNKRTVLRADVTNVANKSYWAKAHYTNLALGKPRTISISVAMDY